MALEVVSFENGLKSHYFSSLFSCFAIFFVFCFFMLILFWPGFASNLQFFFGRFLALGVVSFENGFKSPYFSSLFSCFAIFLVFRYFCVVLFSAFFFVDFFYFLFFVFWLWGSFRLKMASKPLTFHLFFRVLRFFCFLC